MRLWVSCVFSESLYLRWRMPIAHSIRDLALKMRKVLKPGPSMMLLNFRTHKPLILNLFYSYSKGKENALAKLRMRVWGS